MDLAMANRCAEFMSWLWYTSELEDDQRSLPGSLKNIRFWVDERIAFREAHDTRIRAVVTGESPASTPEARAALRGGKVLQELRIFLVREELEYQLTLRSPNLDLNAVKLPQMVQGTLEETLYERMTLFEEIQAIVAEIFSYFCKVRLSPEWETEVLPAMQEWIEVRA